MKIDTVTLRNSGDIRMPKIGIGTWHMGEQMQTAETEISALRHACDLGFTHFDTAEMYADGGSEDILGRAMAGQDRGRLFITSKVYPWNAARNDMITACERSLDRLQTDYVDLYLLHWPGSVPFDETLEGARALLDQSKIRAFGVSNFDTRGIQQLIGEGLADLVTVNQVMHNIPNRGVELDLFPLMAEHGIAAVAYSPLEVGPTRAIPGMQDLAREEGLSVAQLILAWHMSRGLAAPIPKSSRIEHLNDLAAAAQTQLSSTTLERIDSLAPAPDRPVPLEIR
ncbi:aldo/keto reductase [Puniceibacterium sp. IMCC21224]|uniref:aldo/keto reductase n=1 Tax=Puniceibacterium sp. IMCC21224 TaxID=1618204 RepID=UPI00064DF8A9|nr:aldo/keto reductase [Puniceibacterium sp. IMCC21224]KMK68207.1 aldo/keto reductase, diketogulonate reductase [Puniceibacterium sp. IMCC21224]